MAFDADLSAVRSRPHAVLWDMDGTLCDTEPFWIESEFELARRLGKEWTQEDALSLVGNDLLNSGEYIRRRWELDLTPRQVVDMLHDEVVDRVLSHDIPWRPGALDLLEELNEAGVPCALVTMSWELFAHPIIERLPRGRFDAIITGDKVARGKPFPDPYLDGAAALGVDAAHCVAIEDSNTGASSAEAAGCVVLTVPSHVAIAPGPRRITRPSLAGVGLADLADLFAQVES
ncbi:HAD family phosphatase [Nocardioides sp.]|uniref:HAD family hydrolase n=1 Tax=Nocardioides sp. TaxID=35761 RepID=UPI0026305BA5|nr:HAD family phosphatase [Nocardioides sp.]